jgi:hypothetical protein
MRKTEAMTEMKSNDNSYGMSDYRDEQKKLVQKAAFLEAYLGKVAKVELDLEVGDIVLTGRYKNKRNVVKEIGTDELGQPTVNGMKLLAMRLEKKMPKNRQSKETQKQALVGLESKTAFLEGYFHKDAADIAVGGGSGFLPGLHAETLPEDPMGRMRSTYLMDPGGYFPRMPQLQKFKPRWESIKEKYEKLREPLEARRDTLWEEDAQVPSDDTPEAQAERDAIEDQLTDTYNKSRDLYNKQKIEMERAMADAARESDDPIMRQEHVDAARRALPTVKVRAAGGRRPAHSVNAYYNPEESVVQLPPVGTKSLSTLFHEFTHASDPAINVDPRAALRSDGWVEAELPAMAAERSVDWSPYAKSPSIPRTPYGRGIQQHGPQLTGHIDRDLAHLRTWMHALRGIPHTQLRDTNPYAYNASKLTPQQRASNLHNAYQTWLKSQMAASKRNADTVARQKAEKQRQKAVLPASGSSAVGWEKPPKKGANLE